MIDPDVALILEAVPEFVGRYLDLVESADGDPGAPATFTELADFVADALLHAENPRGVLERCLSAVERVARESAEAEELVGWAFLDSLCPEDLARIGPWLGPRTERLAEQIGFSPPPRR